MKQTMAFHITLLYRDFLAYTTEALKSIGVSFGQMPFLVYIGKHPGCTQADLTRALRLDWGYSQRSVARLAEAGFLRKEYDGQKAGNCLTLTETGRSAFDTSHRVFASWDRLRLSGLSEEEQETLILLLSRITAERKGSY